MTETTNARTSRKLTGAATVKLGNLILAHCQTVAGGCVYEEGYTDLKIAEEFGCTLNNVAGLRKQMLGNLVDPPQAPVTDPRVDEILETLAAMREKLGKLETRVADLESRLAGTH